MKRLTQYLFMIGLWTCLSMASLVHAQSLDQAGVVISPEERAKLQAVLDAPVDESSL